MAQLTNKQPRKRVSPKSKKKDSITLKQVEKNILEHPVPAMRQKLAMALRDSFRLEPNVVPASPGEIAERYGLSLDELYQNNITPGKNVAYQIFITFKYAKGFESFKKETAASKYEKIMEKEPCRVNTRLIYTYAEYQVLLGMTAFSIDLPDRLKELT